MEDLRFVSICLSPLCDAFSNFFFFFLISKSMLVVNYDDDDV